jgi:putative membrane protein
MRLHHKHNWHLMVSIAAIAFGAAACGDDDDSSSFDAGFDASTAGTGGTGGSGGTGGRTGSGGTGATDGGGGSQVDAGMLSDSEIIHVVITANNGEIQAAQLARTEASDSQVKTFANRMITDHTDANDTLMSFASSANLTPTDNALSQQLKGAATKEKTALMKLNGSAFDLAYMQAQVQDHETVLMTLDDVLLPQVNDSQLRTRLQAIRTKVMMHLSMARDILDQLEGDGGVEDAGT